MSKKQTLNLRQAANNTRIFHWAHQLQSKPLVLVYNGKPTAPFLSCLAKKLVDISGDPRERQWLHQCLSLAVVRGNAASTLACVQVWSDFSHPYCINQCSCLSLDSLQCIAIAFRMSMFSVSFIIFSMYIYAFYKASVQYCFAPLFSHPD